MQVEVTSDLISEEDVASSFVAGRQIANRVRVNLRSRQKLLVFIASLLRQGKQTASVERYGGCEVVPMTSPHTGRPNER
jgi:hypothetical protein